MTGAPQARLPPNRRSAGSAWWLRLGLALLVAVLNGVAWFTLSHQPALPEGPSRVGGLAYAPFGRYDAPGLYQKGLPAVLAHDMAQMARLTHQIRTYSAAQHPGLALAAQAAGLRLSLGIWLNRENAHNQREIEAGLRDARAGLAQHLIVGNETLLRRELSPQQLIHNLRRVRAASPVPVTTAEPWHLWLAHPELAGEVDFLTVHLLPYWEGVPAEEGVETAMQRLRWVQERHPGKPIWIGEVGFPSEGAPVGRARPTPAAQALFVREFVALAAREKLNYFLIEAYDQAWKTSEEGRAGAHWGMFDATRQPKFELNGPLVSQPHWLGLALISSSLAAVLVLWWVRRFRNLRWPAKLVLVVGTQATTSLGVGVVALPLAHYMALGDWLLLALLGSSTVLMVLILLAHLSEFVELFLRGNLRRQFGALPAHTSSRPPFVSIHLPCCNEPPAMVIATLEALRALDYSAFEVLVIDNNTTDEALWTPVQAHVATLPAHFRFFHLPQSPGYKAGALRFALEQADARTELVAVVDADYLVQANWLNALVGHFEDAQVAVVQAPQAHRNWAQSAWRTMMNWEYEGFFRIGMHHRNERDAIIQHGTMTLVRAQALRAVGGWSSNTVCEDAELGLRLMQAGHRTVYVDAVLGEGLTPDGFAAFKRQRQRWAQGGMQIFRLHARALLWPSAPQGAAGLSAGQRYHFLAGWLPWLGDALHLLFVFLACFWTAAVLIWPEKLSWPTAAYLMPLMVFCAAKLVMGPLLYARRVPCTVWGSVGAALAGMGLAHGIARGVWQGLFSSERAFHVTRKGSAPGVGLAPGSAARVRAALRPVREEALLLLALLLAAAAVAHTASGLSGLARSDAWMWMAMLLLQALPYTAAVLCAGLAAWPERAALLPEQPRAKPPAQAVAGSATRTPVALTPSVPRSGRQTSGSG
jgi:exo-beta-1,3-glucanase (GH17 family)/cellulose synthase/poly-beta-1,6-N-acetylglucosamine synthase-like glycosyltransferase